MNNKKRIAYFLKKFCKKIELPLDKALSSLQKSCWQHKTVNSLPLPKGVSMCKQFETHCFCIAWDPLKGAITVFKKVTFRYWD